MSSILGLPRRPACVSCLRRLAGEDLPRSRPSHLLLRGKKKSAKSPETINVKLLVDMKGYGRKGIITPVAPGRMRNAWYPRQQAEYISTVQDVNPRSIVAERDFTFGIEQEKPETAAAERRTTTRAPVRTRVRLLTPQISTEILSELLPSRLVFHRVPIIDAESETEVDRTTETIPPRRQEAADSVVPEPDAASERSPTADTKLSVIPIFGSVTTADIAEEMKKLLLNDKEGQRVVIGAEDINIISETGDHTGAEGDRIKVLGDFQVDVTVKGGEPVRRRVSIRAPER